MNNGDPRFPYPRYLKVPFVFVPDGSPPPLEWMREHPHHFTVPGVFIPRKPREPDIALEPQPESQGQAAPRSEKPTYRVEIDYAGNWITRGVKVQMPRLAPQSEPPFARLRQPEPDPAPEPKVEPAAAAAPRDRPEWLRIAPPPNPMLYPHLKETGPRPDYMRHIPPPGPRRAPDGPPPLGPSPATFEFDPLSPYFTRDLTRKTARIMAGIDRSMRPGGIATPEGLLAAVGAGMQHLAAHQGDVRAALAAGAARGAAQAGANSGSGGFVDASDEPPELPIQVFPPIDEEALKTLEEEGVSPIVAREIAEAEAAARMAIGAGPLKADGKPASGSGARSFAGTKSAQKWQNQLIQRGWTHEQIEEAIANGQSYPAQNNINPSNGATRYVNPQTGQSGVIDNKTGELIHVGGPGFRY